ncbi:FAD-binding oxidoreductase [Psychromarinibacter halotolerans]|uniref:FAD-binding oxidoreductase n=1 Tax=Psychromarinibacter halotolerans TaxID=1775175 RepID=A0ABV7GRA4_9RHOB|nr:FAD-binding oxidoreductase [Psychromarinibacter halotolerans]MDF0596599.1 FAD-binding oxidoreductase [Psychromarinibacter halotolerans]
MSGWGKISDIVGPSNVVRDADGMSPYLIDDRKLYEGDAAAVVRPGTTQEVAAVVGVCADLGWPVVPVGGNTGQVGGAVPRGGPGTVVLSTERLNRIHRIDPDEMVAVAGAGVILSDLQQAAAAEGCFYPVSLGSEGTCRVGGNVSTNAGGINVLRYGNTRDQVLGLEVVLPDGRIWNGLRTLRKDNTGYALKHLFIGAEGTLGIVTAAALKLYPQSLAVGTAFAAVQDPAAAVALLRALRAQLGDCITAYELLPRIALEFGIRHIGPIREPFEERFDWHVLVEAGDADATERLEAALAAAAEDGLLLDAVVAQTGAQRADLWKLREIGAGGHQYRAGALIKHDISVPVGRVPEMIARGTAAVHAALPGTHVIAFGHVGDGNLHYNLVQPDGHDPADFRARTAAMNRIIHDLVAELGGSISAEHGIGLLKREELAVYADPVELDLMHRVKSVLDPQGLMNPGKILMDRGTAS